MFKLDSNKITLKSNRLYFGTVIIAIIMAIIGFRILFLLLPFEEDATYADVFGLIFLCVWIVIVLSIGIFAFLAVYKKIEINDEGVLCRSFFKKTLFKWSEIRDWGLSYCGQTRFEGNTYYFYFSKEPQEIKNVCKKKLKGKMIKVLVVGSEYAEVVSKVIPFCKKRTSIEPFIGKDKFHLI